MQKMASVNESISIGGERGHIEEDVSDPIFITIYNSFRWKMIPNCTGRYICRDHKAVSHMKPAELLEAAGISPSQITLMPQYYVTIDKERKDPIFVVPFANVRLTGLITYVKSKDDVISYVHTMNAPSGFHRKLDAIDVILSESCGELVANTELLSMSSLEMFPSPFLVDYLPLRNDWQRMRSILLHISRYGTSCFCLS